MYCAKCGSELDEYSLICLECGNVVNKGKHRKKQTPNKFDIEKMFQITNYISVVCICLVAIFHFMFLYRNMIPTISNTSPIRDKRKNMIELISNIILSPLNNYLIISNRHYIVYQVFYQADCEYGNLVADVTI